MKPGDKVIVIRGKLTGTEYGTGIIVGVTKDGLIEVSMMRYDRVMEHKTYIEVFDPHDLELASYIPQIRRIDD